MPFHPLSSPRARRPERTPSAVPASSDRRADGSGYVFGAHPWEEVLERGGWVGFTSIAYATLLDSSRPHLPSCRIPLFGRRRGGCRTWTPTSISRTQRRPHRKSVDLSGAADGCALPLKSDRGAVGARTLRQVQPKRPLRRGGSFSPGSHVQPRNFSSNRQFAHLATMVGAITTGPSA